MGIGGERMPDLYRLKNPMEKLLEIMQNKHTFKDLQDMLEEIERWDVLDDIQAFLGKTCSSYSFHLKIWKTA